MYNKIYNSNIYKKIYDLTIINAIHYTYIYINF